MTEQEQIDALKAQVNCLRHCLQQARNDEDREAFERCFGRTLATTSDQCLAEVKAKAIESVREQIGLLQRYSFLALRQHPSVTKVPDQSGRWIDRDAVDDLIEKHINSLLEQAK